MLTKKLFALNNEKSWRSMLIRDGKIYLANSNFKTDDDFWESYEKKGLFKQKKDIDIVNITKLVHPENNATRLDVTASSGKFFLQFTNAPDLEEVTEYLRTDRRLTPQTTSLSTFRAITPSLIGFGVTAFITWLVWMDAKIIEEGNYPDTSGRRSLFKKLFAWLGEHLGTTGTLLLGGAIALFFLWNMWKASQNPPNEVVYE